MDVLARLIHDMFLQVDGTKGWNKIGPEEASYNVNKAFNEQVPAEAEAYIWTIRRLTYKGIVLDKLRGRNRTR